MISEVFWSSVIGYEFRRVTLPFSSEPSENNPDWSPLPSGIGTRLPVLLRAFSRVDSGRRSVSLVLSWLDQRSTLPCHL